MKRNRSLCGRRRKRRRRVRRIARAAQETVESMRSTFVMYARMVAHSQRIYLWRSTWKIMKGGTFDVRSPDVWWCFMIRTSWKDIQSHTLERSPSNVISVGSVSALNSTWRYIGVYILERSHTSVPFQVACEVSTRGRTCRSTRKSTGLDWLLRNSQQKIFLPTGWFLMCIIASFWKITSQRKGSDMCPKFLRSRSLKIGPVTSVSRTIPTIALTRVRTHMMK